MRTLYDDQSLPALTRGYKVSGRKLLPRDSHAAFELRSLNCRNMRQLKRETAKERAFYSDPKNFPGVIILASIERKLHLSTRAIKTVQTAFMMGKDDKIKGRNRNRYLDAIYADCHSDDDDRYYG